MSLRRWQLGNVDGVLMLMSAVAAAGGLVFVVAYPLYSWMRTGC